MAKTTKTPGTGTADGSGADELMAAAGMNPASQDAQDGGGSVTNNATGEEPAAEPMADPLPETELNPANIEAPAQEENLQSSATAGPEQLPKILPQDQRPPVTQELPARLPEWMKSEPMADPGEDEDAEEDDSPMYPGDPIDAKASELHAARLKKYGADYVVTVRPGTNQRQIWSRHSWNMIRGGRNGWKEVSPIPAEVRNLNK